MQTMPVTPPPDGYDPAVDGLKPQQEQDPDAYPGIIDLPDGLEESRLLGEATSMNRRWDEYFGAARMQSIKNALKTIQGAAPAGSLPESPALPLSQNIMQTCISRLMRAALGRVKHVECQQQIQDVMSQLSADEADEYEKWMNQSMVSIRHFERSFESTLFSALSQGVGVAEVQWRLDGNPVADDTIPMGQIQLDPVDLFDFAWDPREKVRFSDASWCRRRKMVTASELKRLEADGFIGRAQKAIDSAPREKSGLTGEGAGMVPGNRDPELDRARNVAGHNLPVLTFDGALYQLDQFWATISWDVDGESVSGEFNFWIVGGQVLVRMRRSPYEEKRCKPFLTMPILMDNEGLAAKSIIETVFDAMRSVATNLSRKERVMTRIAETPTFYGIGSGLNAKSKLLQENSLVPVFDPDQIKLGPIPVEIVNALDKHINFMLGEIRQGTMANDQAQGLQQEGVNTATEAEILNSGSATRFDWVANRLGMTFFVEMAEWVQLMTKLYGSTGSMIYRSAGQQGSIKTIKPEWLNLPWRYLSSQVSEEGWRQKRFQQIKGIVVELMQVQATNPQALQSNGKLYKVDLPAVMRDTLMPLLGISSDSILKEEVMPMPVDPMAMDQGAMGAPVMDDAMSQAAPEAMPSMELPPIDGVQ